MSCFFTVAEEFENVIVIERSKFICTISHVESEEQAKEFIAKIRKKYSLANHNTYAYISDELGLNQKFSDDGEPQGTAGMPMLNVLKLRNIFQTVAVVTRFFGGIKLGAGGLVRAYSSSVSECLDKSKLKEMVKAVNYLVSCDYEIYSKLLPFLTEKGYKISDIDYGDCVNFNLCARKLDENYYLEIEKQLLNFCNGKIKLSRQLDTVSSF